MINEFMRVRMFPQPLRKRVRAAFEVQYPNRRLFTTPMVESHISQALRGEMCARCLHTVP